MLSQRHDWALGARRVGGLGVAPEADSHGGRQEGGKGQVRQARGLPMHRRHNVGAGCQCEARQAVTQLRLHAPRVGTGCPCRRQQARRPWPCMRAGLAGQHRRPEPSLGKHNRLLCEQ